MADLNKTYDDLLLNILKDLSESDVKFVVCGGIACVLHGVNRYTYDLDLSVDLKEDNLRKIIDVTNKYKLVPRIPEPPEALLNEDKRNEWINNKGAMVFTFVSAVDTFQLDIFLHYPINFVELYKNADKILIDNLEFFISSKEDLLRVKKNIEPLREEDKIDIKQLEKIIENERK